MQVSEEDDDGTPYALAGPNMTDGINIPVTAPLGQVVIEPNSTNVFWQQGQLYNSTDMLAVTTGTLEMAEYDLSIGFFTGYASGLAIVGSDLFNVYTTDTQVCWQECGITSCTASAVCTTETPDVGMTIAPDVSAQPGILYSDITKGEIIGTASNTHLHAPGALYLASDQVYVYWSTGKTSYEVYQADIVSQGSPQTIASAASGVVTGLATDGTKVYFAVANQILSVPVGNTSVGNAHVVAKQGAANTTLQHLKWVPEAQWPVQGSTAMSSALIFDDGKTIYEVALH